MYKCKAWTHYISESAHMCGCDTKHAQTDNYTLLTELQVAQSWRPRSLWGRHSAYWTNNWRKRQSHLLPVSLLFTQSSWRSSSWFALNEPPAGSLNRPLINPSVGSLLHPQPYEEGSNPAKQTERRLSSWRVGEEEKKERERVNQQRNWFLLTNHTD